MGGGRRRQHARIGGEEIAAGGQHVAPSARPASAGGVRARRAGRRVPPAGRRVRPQRRLGGIDRPRPAGRSSPLPPAGEGEMGRRSPLLPLPACGEEGWGEGAVSPRRRLVAEAPLTLPRFTSVRTSPHEWGEVKSLAGAARPKTCKPSLTAKSLRSHSHASMRRSAVSGSAPAPTPASRASPLRRAVSTTRAARRPRRRGSSPSAWEYSSTRRSSARASPLNGVAADAGGRWPMVTAPMRRLAWAASPGLLTMNG